MMDTRHGVKKKYSDHELTIGTDTAASYYVIQNDARGHMRGWLLV